MFITTKLQTSKYHGLVALTAHRAAVHIIQRDQRKRKPLFYCPYICQMLTDFQADVSFCEQLLAIVVIKYLTTP